MDLDTAAPELNAPAPEPDSPTEDIEAPTTNNIVEPSDDRSFVADDITPVVDRGEEVTTNVAQLVESIRNDKLFDAEHTVRWSLDQALIEALVSSHRVSGLKLQPLVELQNVGIAYGQFDILGFVESTFEDASTPVADIFDSSNPAIQSRINNQQSELKPGLRKELQSGGRIEISQSYRSFDDNSGQLIPPDQAHSALELNMSKELLRGASRSVAMNQVLVAHHDTASARARSTAEIAEHLGEVTEAYWTVFAARGEVIARSEARENALKVLRELRARTDIDAERNLIAQTQTSVAQREIAINQAYNRLTNAQYLLVALINSPTLQLGTSRLELITASEPDLTSREIALEERLSTAIQRRPEIRAAAQSIKSSEVLRHFTINQLLPKLTFSVESSFNGLASERNIGAAIRDQFDDDLSYQLGLDLELPWGNRVARFSKRRAEYALAVAMSRWREAIENTKADVLTAGQDFVSVQQRYERQLEVLRFSTDELRYLQLRKSIAPAENAIPSLELTQILSAQDRQTEATTALVEAIAEKYRSLFRLNQATGIAVQEDVLPSESHLANPRFLKIYHQFLEDTPVLGRYANAVGAGTQARSRTFPKR